MHLRRSRYAFSERFKSSRGIILAEIILLSAVLVAGIGVLLGVLIDMRTRAVKSQNQIAMENQARRVASEARALLQSAVHPSSLDLNTSSPLRFAAKECSIISSNDFCGRDLYLTTIRTVAAPASPGEDGARGASSGRKRVQVYRSILDGEKTIDNRESSRFLGADQDEYSCSVEFEYASSAEETLELKPFVRELAAQAYPRVIRIRIHVETIRKKRNAGQGVYDLTTAVRVL